MEKCRLADSESKIWYLNQKIKTYDDDELSKTQVIKEIKKLQRAKNTPKKVMESKGAQNTGKHNERQTNTKQNDTSCVIQVNLYENRKQGEMYQIR